MSEYHKPRENIVEIIRVSDRQIIDKLKMRLYDFPVFQRSKNREFELHIFSEHYKNINDYTFYKTYNHPIFVEHFPYIACLKGHRNDVYLHKKQRDDSQEYNTQEYNQYTVSQDDIDYDGIIVKSYGSTFLEDKANDSYVESHTLCKEL
jgi:hypothetical protein